jgi:hypothetical protein
MVFTKNQRKKWLRGASLVRKRVALCVVCLTFAKLGFVRPSTIFFLINKNSKSFESGKM